MDVRRDYKPHMILPEVQVVLALDPMAQAQQASYQIKYHRLALPGRIGCVTSLVVGRLSLDSPVEENS